MATVNDVAAYILEQQTPMTGMKLQKLTYYSQAWHLVWEGEPLFSERIEAWMNGPVTPALYAQHRGCLFIDDWPSGDSSALSVEERETISAVLDAYGDMSPENLSELTHSEAPWLMARKGLSPTSRGNHVVTVESMREFYGAIAGS